MCYTFNPILWKNIFLHTYGDTYTTHICPFPKGMVFSTSFQDGEANSTSNLCPDSLNYLLILFYLLILDYF